MKKTIFTLAILLLQFLGHAQYTAIPDANFEQALFDQGIDAVNGDNQVLTSAISGVTFLNVSAKGITNLSGILGFTGLKTLWCFNNQLTTLNVSGMTNLEFLDCSVNALTSINVSGLSALYYLNFDQNQISSINLNGLNLLVQIQCSGNQLTSIDINGLTNLQVLMASSNQLTSLNLSGLTMLSYLYCNANQLTVLDVSSNTDLQVLDCSDNLLVDLNITGLTTTLTTLECANNQLTSLNVSALSALFILNSFNNPNLFCVGVTDPTAALANPNWYIDPTASYSTSCGPVVPTTEIKPAFWDATLAINANINAYYVPGYQMYRFEVSDGVTTKTYEATKYNFDLTKIPGIAYATTYSIRVALKMGGTWGVFGNAHNVTTPVLDSDTVLSTKLLPTICGATLATLDTKIGTSPVYQAADTNSSYRFEITTGGVTTVYDSPTYNFKLRDAGLAAYGTTYTIRVAAVVNGFYGNYGTSCEVTTPALTSNNIPTTSILPAICGTTLTSLTTKIGATPVYNASGYRFEITTGGVTTIYDSAVYNFKLSQTGATVLYSTTYAIRVASLVNGVYGNYGASCNVTTPTDPNVITRLKAKLFEVSAYPNPFETAFNLNIETPSKEKVTIAVYDMMGKLVETHQVNPMEVANLQIGNNFAAGIYNVIVSQANEMQAIRLIRR